MARKAGKGKKEPAVLAAKDGRLVLTSLLKKRRGLNILVKQPVLCAVPKKPPMSKKRQPGLRPPFRV